MYVNIHVVYAEALNFVTSRCINAIHWWIKQREATDRRLVGGERDCVGKRVGVDRNEHGVGIVRVWLIQPDPTVRRSGYVRTQLADT